MFGNLRPVSAIQFASGPTRLRTKLAQRILNKDFPVTDSLTGLREDNQQSGFLTASAAIEAQFVTTEAVCKVGTQVFMSEYSKHIDYQDGNEIVRWGVGLRFVFTVESFDLSVRTDTLPALAAAAELKLARVTCAFKTIGIHGEAALKLFPTTQSMLDVQGLPNVIAALDNVRGLIYSDKVTITPWFLSEATSKEGLTGFVHSPAFRPTLLALQCIANGRSLEDARIDLAKLKVPAEELQLVEAVYGERIRRTANERPDRTERDAAAKLISGT